MQWAPTRGWRLKAFCLVGALLVFSLVLALAKVTVAGGGGDQRSLHAEVYRRPLGNDPATLDPARIGDVYSRSVAQQIFDGLVQFDQTLAIVPALAQFWKASRDGLTWTFTLRKGVKFHHGREVLADDVVYSLTRLLDPHTKSGAADLLANVKGAHEFRSGNASRVSGLTAIDKYTVQVTLTDAPVPLVSVLAVGHAKIVPRELVEQQGDAFGTRPVGTGPFSFVDWQRGRQIVLAANPNYFDGPPRLSRLIYRIFPGGQLDEMYAEFQRGNLEDAPVPVRNYHQIVSDPSHHYVKRPMLSVRFYGLNTRVKPLDDRRVRLAIASAIDRAAIVREAFFDRYVPAQGILPPGTQGFNPKLRPMPYAPERARRLLAEAGYSGGRGLPPIPIWSSVRHEGILREHEILRRNLEAVGIRPEFHYFTDWPGFSAKLVEQSLPVFLYAWFADVPDPENFLFKLFYSGSSRNLFGYRNPVVDDLLLKARNAGEVRQRVNLYRQAEQTILDDAPIVPIFHYTYERLFQPYVRSVEVNGLGDPYIPLRKIWLDRGERPAR